MVKTSPLVDNARNLATMVATMIATSRKDGNFGYEQPAIEKQGVKTINYQLAAGLLSLGLAGCGGTEINNHYYGPDGEEILVESGSNCGEFKGKYIFDPSCELYTDKIKNDCTFKMSGDEGREWVGSITGNRMYLNQIRGEPDNDKPTMWNVDMYKKGQFTAADVRGDTPGLVASFMCLFDHDENLWAVNWGNGLKANTDNILALLDQPFSPAYCERTSIFNQSWYDSCWE